MSADGDRKAGRPAHPGRGRAREQNMGILRRGGRVRSAAGNRSGLRWRVGARDQRAGAREEVLRAAYIGGLLVVRHVRVRARASERTCRGRRALEGIFLGDRAGRIFTGCLHGISGLGLKLGRLGLSHSVVVPPSYTFLSKYTFTRSVL